MTFSSKPSSPRGLVVATQVAFTHVEDFVLFVKYQGDILHMKIRKLVKFGQSTGELIASLPMLSIKFVATNVMTFYILV